MKTFMERGGGWVIAQSVLMPAALALALVFPGDGHRSWVTAAGALLLVVGGAIGVAGVWVLDRNRTAFPRPRPGSRLVQQGVYAWMRHPLYTSVVLALVGWALIWQSLPALGAALVLFPFFDAKARREERWLAEQFPEHDVYRQRVRRFIPGVY